LSKFVILPSLKKVSLPIRNDISVLEPSILETSEGFSFLKGCEQIGISMSWQARIVRSNNAKVAGVAQSVEQLICNQQVVGSIPTASSVRSRAVNGSTASIDNALRNTTSAKVGTCGQVAEWSIAPDCKSGGFGLRWFESIPAHHSKHASCWLDVRK
jgi:hypothetical protein